MRELRARFYKTISSLFPAMTTLARNHLKSRYCSFPTLISVELTNRCNAACIMCPRQYMTRPKGIMKAELYEKILNEISLHQSGVNKFQPFLFGEALVHPQFCELIKLTRQKLPRVMIYLSSNGGLLGEKQSDAILQARVDKLNIDIDGFTAETAESIRKHVNHEQVKANVLKFIEMRNAGNYPTRLRVSIIRMPQNEHEVDRFVEFWKPVADQVKVVKFNTWLGSIEDAAKTDFIPFDFPCSHPYREAAIAWDGRVSLCCLDYDMKHVTGDLENSTLQEIWQGEPMQKARTALENLEYSRMPICKECNAAQYQQNGLWRHLWLPKKANASHKS